ncbi:MAG TPA: EAL domain-containing protein [Burkholderiales bacterium]|nr:EAL domain-containing protein [Burkholderiales bacterium]
MRQLYRLSRATYAGSLLSAVVIVAALWEAVPLLPLLLWAAALVAVMAARFFLQRAFVKRNPPDVEAPRWCAYFVLGTFAAGALWGVLGSVLYPAHAMPQEFLVMFVIGGMVIAAVLVLAPVHNAFLAFLLPAVMPVIPTVFLQDTTVHFYMGVLLLVFLVVMLATGPMISEMIRDSIAMKYAHTELLAQLSETHAVSRLANRQLSEQIYAQRVMAEQLRQASQKLSALIEASPLAIIVRDVEGRVESWNAAAERIFGWSQEEVRGSQPPYHPPAYENEDEQFRRNILSGQSVSGIEATRMTKHGREIDVSISSALVQDVAGRPTGYVTIIADITERKRAEHQHSVIARITMLLAEAQSAEDAIPHVLEAMCVSFGFVYGARWLLDRQNLLLRCAETWNLPTPELTVFRDRSKARFERPAKLKGLTRRVWDTGTPHWIEDIERDAALDRRAHALEAGLRCAFCFPVAAGGELYGVMEFFGRDVRQPDDTVLQVAQTVSSYIGQFIARKQAERNLQFVASHDALTGLFNRSMFSQRLQQALAQAHRHERRLAVLFIDLDGFKLINDMLGHDAGDVLLADLANRLRECMREGDTLGRMGGDEFVVLIEGYEDETQLLEVARKVLDTVAEPFLLRDGEYHVTASIGIAAYPQDGEDAPDLLKHADIAMYRAKEHGKNNYQFHSPEMNTHLVERVALENALRRAVERKELVLFYQPKISIAENRVTGVEGLVRWLHPSQGMINPPDFVPLAEDAGLFAAIGEWVLHAACDQAKAWELRGVSGLRVAVNLSMRQFAQENLVERLREAVHDAGIEPGQLDIEVTESILMRHAERAGKLLAQIKDLGAQIVIDDFGTGHSSLGCLNRFPIDAVKIDRSLVAQLPGRTDAVGLTRAVIAMAHSLKLKVIGEGVETRQQWDFLREHGCDAAQGNYFCAPASAEAITAMLLEQPPDGRITNVQQLRPWRALRPGVDAAGDA